MPIDSPRRQRRINTRQNEILSAAARVFAQKGFQHASIHDVAEAADVAIGTIYNYFENKDALLDAIMTRLAQSEQAPLLTQAGSMQNLVTDRMALLKEQYDLVMAVLPEILGTPELRQRYLDHFVVPVANSVEKDLQLLQEGKPDAIDSHLAARLLVASVLGFQVLCILGDESVLTAWDHPETLSAVWSRFISMGLRD